MAPQWAWYVPVRHENGRSGTSGLPLLRATVLTDATFSELLPDAPADDGCAPVLRCAA